MQNRLVKSDSIEKPNIQTSLFNHLDYKNVIRSCRIYDDGFGKLYVSFVQDGKEYSLGKLQNIDLSISGNLPESVGTVDYTTGKIEINNFKPISSSNSVIKVYANVYDSDVFVNPDTILSIDENDPNSVIINFVESAFRKPIK